PVHETARSLPLTTSFRPALGRTVMQPCVRFVLLTILVLGLVGVVVVTVRFMKPSEEFPSATDATIRAKTDNWHVRFELRYGKDVTHLVEFTVRDADGKELWTLQGFSEPKPARLVYGVVPEGAKQTFPSEGKPPDVRGKHIKVEANCRFRI